ncbi:CaiB/BaiF CoA transferase family protein [Thermodesulfobacteriota bacterium]
MKKVLEGIRVLDCSRIVAGPYCSLLLASMGAEVIHIERPGGEIDWEIGPPLAEGEGRTSHPLYTNCNKKGITLNLGTEKGRQLFSELVKRSDVVVQNYSYGGAKKFNLTYEQLEKINPKIIVAAISGFGQTGPYHERNCWDPNAQAMSGMMSLGGFPGSPPTRTPLPVVDMSSGVYGALGIMYALRHRDMTGEGQLVDVALFDVATYYTGIVAMEMDKANQQRIQVGNATYWAFANTFRARDGWVFISLTTDGVWKRFCRLIEKEDLISDKRYRDDYHRFINRETLIPEVEEWTKSNTVSRLVEITEKNHIPCSPVNDIATAMADPQVQAREMLVDIDYGGDLGQVPVPGVVVKMSKTPGMIDEPCPSPGQDNKEVYGKILGMEDNELESLAVEGII